MPPLPGPRPETSELRVLTRTEVTDGVVLAVTVEILQTSRPTDELPPPCPVAERAARGVGNPSTRSRQDELSEIARDRAGSGGQGGKRRSAQQPLSTCSPCPFCHQACSAHGRNPCEAYCPDGLPRMGIHESTRAGSAATGSAAKRPRQQQLGTADASRIISADKDWALVTVKDGVVTMKDDTGAKYWGSEEKRAARWAERSMKAESQKVVYPDVEDGLDYAPPLKTLPPQWRVFGRPTIALPDKEQQHEHQRHHQDVADHAGPLRTSHHL